MAEIRPSSSSTQSTAAAEALLLLGGDTQNEIPDVDMDSDGEPAQEINKKQWKAFNYQVPWDKIPLSILQRLDAAQRAGSNADPLDVIRLRKWISKDLFNAYELFKKNYYVKTKTAGVKIYELISSEVCEKYTCIKVTTDNEEIEEGYPSFLLSLTHSMENKGRWGTPVDDAPCASHARQAKGTPGVLADQYAPHLTETMEISQEAYRDVMITISRLTHKKSWDIQKITKLMHLTYELQRRDIGQALQVIAEEQEENQDDPENESEIRKLKLNWPFLFELRWQSSHFLRLCGRSLEIPMRDYYDHHLRTLLQFVTNPNTESGVKNIAEQWKWEDAGKKSELKFLLAFKMLANYFNENTDEFITTAERTSTRDEIESSVRSGGLTLIALDRNMYAAQNIYVTLDGQVIMMAEDSTDALTGLMQCAFIFDAHYPKQLKFTFEFLERVVCKLGSEHTRRDAQAVCLSALVTRMVNSIEKLNNKLKKYLEN